MRIGQAFQYYSNYLDKLQEKRSYLMQKREEQLESQKAPNTDIIDLQIKEIDKDSEKIRVFTQKLQETKANLENMEQSKDSIEAEEEKWAEEVKCLEVFRRICNGDHVPPEDEKKLMEYNFEMYQSAKNMAMMKQNKDPKEYDSLWDDEPEEEDASIPVEERMVPIEEPELSDIKVSMDVPDAGTNE